MIHYGRTTQVIDPDDYAQALRVLGTQQDASENMPVDPNGKVLGVGHHVIAEVRWNSQDETVYCLTSQRLANGLWTEPELTNSHDHPELIDDIAHVPGRGWVE